MSSLPTRAEGRRDEDREIKYVSPPGVAAFSVIVTHLASKLVQQGSTFSVARPRTALRGTAKTNPSVYSFTAMEGSSEISYLRSRQVQMSGSYSSDVQAVAAINSPIESARCRDSSALGLGHPKCRLRNKRPDPEAYTADCSRRSEKDLRVGLS